MRDLAAPKYIPFPIETPSSPSILTPLSVPLPTPLPKFQNASIDADQNLTPENYFGPTEESNWVIRPGGEQVKGGLIAGAYPATTDDEITESLLSRILNAGVTHFITLQSEYPESPIPEYMWRNRTQLRPYFEDVKKMTNQLNACEFAKVENIEFTRCPIDDGEITHDEIIQELSINIATKILGGQIIYLHCWGGHGRTGTVVSIVLHLIYGLNSRDAMFRCQRVHDLRQNRVFVSSPHTPIQRNQVARIIYNFELANRQQQSNLEPTQFPPPIIQYIDPSFADTNIAPVPDIPSFDIWTI
jgi:protein-tyrosine phosphatase